MCAHYIDAKDACPPCAKRWAKGCLPALRQLHAAPLSLLAGDDTLVHRKHIIADTVHMPSARRPDRFNRCEKSIEVHVATRKKQTLLKLPSARPSPHCVKARRLPLSWLGLATPRAVKACRRFLRPGLG
jgi:hypothetical protein